MVVAVGFHNCGSGGDVNFSTNNINRNPNSTSIVSQASGTGEGFFGKPGEGDYDRKFPNYQCQNTSSSQASMKVSSTQASLESDNCEATNLPIPFVDPALAFAPYDPDFITYRGSIFEKRIAGSDLNSISEVFCSSRTNSEGIDIVIKRDASGAQRMAKIYYGEAISPELGFAGGWSGKTASATSILLNENSGDLRFYSESVNFELSVPSTLANQLTFTGQFVVTLDQAVIAKNVTCRVMNTKPVLWVDQTGLITYFKFDDPIYQNGGSYIDNLNRLSGTLQTGDANNKATSGINGGALGLDGTNDSFVIGGGASLNVTTQMSVSISLRVTNATPVTEVMSIVQRQDPTTNQFGEGFLLGILALDPAFNPLPVPQLGFYKDAGVGCRVSIPWTNPTGNFHVAVTDDGTNLRMYFDGQLRATSSSAGCQYRALTTPICIGSAANVTTGVCTGEYLGANFDEFSYWNRALTADEVAAIYGRRSLIP